MADMLANGPFEIIINNNEKKKNVDGDEKLLTMSIESFIWSWKEHHLVFVEVVTYVDKIEIAKKMLAAFYEIKSNDHFHTPSEDSSVLEIPIIAHRSSVILM